MRKIRQNKFTSVNSVNKDSFVSVGMNHTTKPFHFLDVKKTVDQYEVFEKERQECNKYRIILTVNPFCSNVLFNTLTEIVKGEGSLQPTILSKDEIKIGNKEIYGKTDISRYDAIRNTEYSRDNIGFEYRPGFDIFNNHLLRNKSFKVVNGINKGDHRSVFNTIEDVIRQPNGDTIQINVRQDIDTIKTIDKHLYDSEDILDIEGSINANLIEENGWWGFINGSNLNGTFFENKQKTSPKRLNINLPLNDRKECEFIDMYPDRSLFSFNPKYNKFRHRFEYNWEICLTYPFENYYKHPLIWEEGINAVKLYSVEYVIGQNGNKIILFKSYIKHGLKQGDTIKVFCNGLRSKNSYIVSGLGNVEGEMNEYCFWLNDINVIDEFNITNIDINEFLKKSSFRFARINGGVQSEYYLRKFKKLPNGEYRNDFDKEQYPLAFSRTIYNDKITQITFTDTIDITDIKDNLDRPLSELYVTIVKNNQGYQRWYKSESPTTMPYKESNNDPTIDVDIEFSHCFGRLSSGLNMPYGEYDDSEKFSDVRKLTNIKMKGMSPFPLEDKDEIKITDDEFFGDVVEFSPMECKETILSDVCFRFNTAQREWNADGDGKNWLGCFKYDEIIYDDYDKGEQTSSNNGSFASKQETITDGNTTRPEGYFYKAHYPIPLREFGDIRQSSHYDIKVNVAKCIVSNNKVFVQVTTSLRHRLSSNDVIYFFDPIKDVWYHTRVSYVMDGYNFIIDPKKINDDNGNFMLLSQVPQLELVNILNNVDLNNLQVLRKNTDIPSYATRIKRHNTFLWREILKGGNKDVTSIPDYVFANGCFYINKGINFYLRRQDPEGKNGLYQSEISPNDVYGKIIKNSNYEYKDEEHILC